MFKVQCPRCDGRGKLDWCDHVSNGVCFKCEGAGHTLRKTKPRPKMEDAEKRAHRLNLVKYVELVFIYGEFCEHAAHRLSPAKMESVRRRPWDNGCVVRQMLDNLDEGLVDLDDPNVRLNYRGVSPLDNPRQVS